MMMKIKVNYENFFYESIIRTRTSIYINNITKRRKNIFLNTHTLFRVYVCLSKKKIYESVIFYKIKIYSCMKFYIFFTNFRILHTVPHTHNTTTICGTKNISSRFIIYIHTCHHNLLGKFTANSFISTYNIYMFPFF